LTFFFKVITLTLDFPPFPGVRPQKGGKLSQRNYTQLLNPFRYIGIVVKNVIFLLICLWGCSPNSSKEFQKEGETHCRSLVLELEKIENREQLLSAEQKLKKQFNYLIDLMIEAREFQEKRFEEEISDEPVFEANSFEEELQKQLRRIYAIEGGREVIERSQQEALVRLDAYERTLAKKRELGVVRK
jgi:hypothetical protein